MRLKFCGWASKLFRRKQEKTLEEWQEKFPALKDYYLVRYSKGLFAVVVDDGIDLDWETTDECDDACKKNSQYQERETIINEDLYLESMVGKNWPLIAKKQAKILLGTVLATAFNGEIPAAKSALEQAKIFIREKGVEISRYIVLRISLFCLALTVGAGGTLFVFHEYAEKHIGGSLVLCLLGACMGGIGTFIAITLRMRDLNIPSTSGSYLHYAESIAMMAVGYVAGFATVLLVKSGLAFASLASDERFPYVLMVLAMASGLSTRWIRLILNQLPTGNGDTTQQSNNPTE